MCVWKEREKGVGERKEGRPGTMEKARGTGSKGPGVGLGDSHGGTLIYVSNAAGLLDGCTRKVLL